ncbi:MAG: histidinol-phosphate transaminase [Dehalococcoidia bacterium]
MTWEKMLRRHLSGLDPYQSIVPLEVLAQEAGRTVAEVIKLDGNENPYGPSPRVRQALAGYPFYHIYPDPDQRQLREALEGYVGLGREHIVVGAGSDELIDLMLRLFLEPGDQVIDLVPTFGMYPFSTHVCGGEVVEVPRDEAFDIDLAAVREKVGPRTKVVFVASPNNPSGNLASPEQVQGLLDMGLLVVVDEAYFEFVGEFTGESGGEMVAPLVKEYPNLVVLRTFSKWAGLAGLRVGYALCHPGLAEHIMRIKPPYNLNVAAQVAALESLKDMEYLQGRVRDIVAERERLFPRLQALDFCHPYPSRANFILCALDGVDARQAHLWLRRQGIFVRYFDTPRLRHCLRISVGKPEHSDAVVEVLQRVGAELASRSG